MFAASLVNTGYCTVQGNPYSVFNCDQSADAVHEDGSTDRASHLLEDSDDELEFTFRLRNTLTFLSGYSFQTMNTASKNCKCEVDEDFALFPNCSSKLTNS